MIDKYFCQCGCNKEITIKPHFKYYGIPKYIRGHFIRSQELKNKISKRHKYKIVSIETKIKISNSKRGKKHGKHWKLTKEQKINQSIAKCGENNPCWKGGITDKPYCEKWTEKLRESIRNEYNRICFICNKKENDNLTKTNKIRKLSVHHIDMDKGQGCDGKKWKLVPLCMACHGKIHKL